MAQVKLIETEQPEQFKPVTIQITFETQEELNAMEAIVGYNKESFNAVKKLPDVNYTSFEAWDKLSEAIFDQITPFAE